MRVASSELGHAPFPSLLPPPDSAFEELLRKLVAYFLVNQPGRRHLDEWSVTVQPLRGRCEVEGSHGCEEMISNKLVTQTGYLRYRNTFIINQEPYASTERPRMRILRNQARGVVSSTQVTTRIRASVAHAFTRQSLDQEMFVDHGILPFRNDHFCQGYGY